MEGIKSFKHFIEFFHIRQPKLREFSLDRFELEAFIDVPDIPNPISYTSVPDLVAKSGDLIRYSPENNEFDLTNEQDNTDILFSTTGGQDYGDSNKIDDDDDDDEDMEIFLFSDMINFTTQSSQEILQSSSQIDQSLENALI